MYELTTEMQKIENQKAHETIKLKIVCMNNVENSKSKGICNH